MQLPEILLQILAQIKLFHWYSGKDYPVHKILDELYSSFSENIDRFVECLISRKEPMEYENMKVDQNMKKNPLKYCEGVRKYLDRFDFETEDLKNIHGELVENISKAIYLLPNRNGK